MVHLILWSENNENNNSNDSNNGCWAPNLEYTMYLGPGTTQINEINLCWWNPHIIPYFEMHQVVITQSMVQTTALALKFTENQTNNSNNLMTHIFIADESLRRFSEWALTNISFTSTFGIDITNFFLFQIQTLICTQ